MALGSRFVGILDYGDTEFQKYLSHSQSNIHLTVNLGMYFHQILKCPILSHRALIVHTYSMLNL